MGTTPTHANLLATYVALGTGQSWRKAARYCFKLFCAATREARMAAMRSSCTPGAAFAFAFALGGIASGTCRAQPRARVRRAQPRAYAGQGGAGLQKSLRAAGGPGGPGPGKGDIKVILEWII